MKAKYRLIVFDWDGTLMDSEARIVECMRLALDAVGADVLADHQLKQVIGLGLKEALATLLPDRDEGFYLRLADAYREYWLDPAAAECRLFNGIEALLYRLHGAGYLLGVATGKSRRGLDRQFDETGLGLIFASSRCADESRSKPAPDMLLAILEELGVSANETLVIGDTLYDLEMARSAGCERIGVTYGVHDHEQLTACEPLDLISSPQALVEWFELNFFIPQRQAAVS